MSKISGIKKRISNSKDGKTVFANFGYLSLLQIAGYVFPLITMPYLARVIGADGFGKIAFASAIVVWIQTISDWGFNLTATRDVAQNRDDKEKVSRIFSNVLWARCLLTVFSGLLLFIAISIVPYFQENAAIIWITFLLIPGYILFPDWFFQAIEKMKYTTIFNLAFKLIFTVAVFIFIRDREDYLIQPLLTTIGYLICGAGALFLILRKWKYKLYGPNLSEIRKTIKGSFPSIFYQFQSVLSRAFYPFLSRRPDKHSFYAKINMATALAGAMLLIVVSPWLIKIMLGDEFEKSVIVMQMLSFFVVFLAMSYTYGTNYLIIHHKERALRNLTFVSSLIGMCVAVPLVYYFTYIGAAITVLLCRGLLGVGSFVLAKKL